MSTVETQMDFETAVFEAPAIGVRCANCSAAIRDVYFEVNGVTVCHECRRAIADLDRPEGGAKRFALAALFGVLGGAAGAIVWYAVAELLNLEIGLIAILVGWLVGTGVRRGSQGRGGWRYQLLAAFVTYAAIVTTYIPPIYAGLTKGAAAGENPGSPSGPGADAAKPALAVPSSTASAPPAASAAAPGLLQALGALALFGAVLYGIAFAAPFLMGLENVIGVLIIGFAVHQAWRMNARRVFEIKGPFRVVAKPTTAPVAEPVIREPADS